MLSHLLHVSKQFIESKTVYKARGDMEADYTALLYYCETRWLSRDKCFTEYLN